MENYFFYILMQIKLISRRDRRHACFVKKAKKKKKKRRAFPEQVG